METVGFHARQAPPDERSSTVRSLSRESSICEAMLRMAHPYERRERSEQEGDELNRLNISAEYFLD